LLGDGVKNGQHHLNGTLSEKQDGTEHCCKGWDKD
jgi:hypothetical protein